MRAPGRRSTSGRNHGPQAQEPLQDGLQGQNPRPLAHQAGRPPAGPERRTAAPRAGADRAAERQAAGAHLHRHRAAPAARRAGADLVDRPPPRSRPRLRNPPDEEHQGHRAPALGDRLLALPLCDPDLGGRRRQGDLQRRRSDLPRRSGRAVRHRSRREGRRRDQRQRDLGHADRLREDGAALEPRPRQGGRRPQGVPRQRQGGGPVGPYSGGLERPRRRNPDLADQAHPLHDAAHPAVEAVPGSAALPRKPDRRAMV